MRCGCFMKVCGETRRKAKIVVSLACGYRPLQRGSEKDRNTAPLRFDSKWPHNGNGTTAFKLRCQQCHYWLVLTTYGRPLFEIRKIQIGAIRGHVYVCSKMRQHKVIREEDTFLVFFSGAHALAGRKHVQQKFDIWRSVNTVLRKHMKFWNVYSVLYQNEKETKKVWQTYRGTPCNRRGRAMDVQIGKCHELKPPTRMRRRWIAWYTVLRTTMTINEV